MLRMVSREEKEFGTLRQYPAARSLQVLNGSADERDVAGNGKKAAPGG
jgi:hypothetical protein